MSKSTAPARRGRWHAAIGVFAAWTLSSLAFWTIPFAMPGIRVAFQLTQTQAAWLISITLAARFAGALIAGSAAELYGRKAPFLMSAAVCGMMGAASATAGSYPVLLLLRAGFGLALGGVWVAGFALALEHLTGRARGTVSGLLQGGWNWGYLVAAIGNAAVGSAGGGGSWRTLLSFGALPLLAVPWILFFTPESPSLARPPEAKAVRATLSPFAQLFRHGKAWTTIHAASVMAGFMALYFCVTTYYQAFVTAEGFKPLQFVVGLNAGAILGGFIFGRLSSTRVAKRGAITVAAVGIPLILPLYLNSGRAALIIGACSMGVFALGMWGVVPRYLAERFPEGVRAIGPGFAYHFGALLASPSPLAIGWLLDHGYALRVALTWTILAACGSLVTMIWCGPETTGNGQTGRQWRPGTR